jgi:hypothetical protein
VSDLTPSNPEYWNTLYLTGDTGWDKGVASPPIVRLAKEGVVPKGASIAVLGAGKGHDAIALARMGFKVTAIDFAPEAAKAMRASGAGIEVIESDIFTVRGNFDAVLEHTCFCAIEVRRRAEYVELVHRLAPTLFGVFYAHGREGGPPFDTNEKELRALFEPKFQIERLRVASDSFEARAGKELEAIFRRR